MKGKTSLYAFPDKFILSDLPLIMILSSMCVSAIECACVYLGPLRFSDNPHSREVGDKVRMTVGGRRSPKAFGPTLKTTFSRRHFLV